MAIQGFDSQKCQQRKSIAAGRYGINTVGLEFKPGAVQASDDFLAMKKSGSLPATPEAALKLINKGLPEGAAELSGDDVYIHLLEAANSNFVGDRFAYIHESTLRNIAKDAPKGVSFMNSHRTGGLSSPSELPFGQTFAGLYEQGLDAKGNPAQRTTVAVFMLRGVQPNGSNGPSTDDLNKQIMSGGLKDVSVGLRDVECICNVCGNDLNDYEKCVHIPGTTEGMTSDEIKAQKERDTRNKTGAATYSIYDATFREISAVYDGAVPGAGAKKVLNFARTHDLSKAEVRAFLEEAFTQYGEFLPFDLGEIVDIKPETNPKPQGKKMADNSTETPSLLHRIAQALGINDGAELQSGQPLVLPLQAQVGLAADPRVADLESKLAEANTALAARKATEDAAATEAFNARLATFKSGIATKIPPADLKSTDNPNGIDLDSVFAAADAAGFGADLTALCAAKSQNPLFQDRPTPVKPIPGAPGEESANDAVSEHLAKVNK